MPTRIYAHAFRTLFPVALIAASAFAQDDSKPADAAAAPVAVGDADTGPMTIMGLPIDDPIFVAAGIAIGAIAIAAIVGGVLWMRGGDDEASGGAKAAGGAGTSKSARPGPRAAGAARPATSAPAAASVPATAAQRASTVSESTSAGGARTAASALGFDGDDGVSAPKPMSGTLSADDDLDLPALDAFDEEPLVTEPAPTPVAAPTPVSVPAPVPAPVAIPVVAPVSAPSASPAPVPVLPRATTPAMHSTPSASTAPIMMSTGAASTAAPAAVTTGPITASSVAREWRRTRTDSLFTFAKHLYEQALTTRGADGHLQRSGLVRLLAERGQPDDLKRADELVGVGGVAGDAIALLRAREQRFDESETELNRLSLHSANEEVRAAALTAVQLVISAYEKRGDGVKAGHLVRTIEWELLRRAEHGTVGDADVERAVARLVAATQWRSALQVATEWTGWTTRGAPWARVVLRTANATLPHSASDGDLASRAESVRREALDLVEAEALADLSRGLRLAATHDPDLVVMARTHLSRAVSGSDRVDGVARPYLAILEVGQGQLDAAEQLAMTSGPSAPGLADLARGTLELARSRFDQAKVHFSKAIEALATQRFFDFPDGVREAIHEARPAHAALKGLCAAHVATGDLAGARRTVDERMVGGPDRANIAQSLVDAGLSAGKVHLDSFRFLYPPAGQTSAEPSVLAKLFEIGSRVLRDPSGFTQDERDTVQRMLEALTPGVERPRGRGRFYLRRYAGAAHPLFEVVWLPSDDDPVPSAPEWSLVALGSDGSKVSRLFERGVFTPESKPYLVTQRDGEAADTFAGARTVAIIDPRQIAVASGDWKLEITCKRSDDREQISFRSEGPSHEEILKAFTDHRERFVMLLTGLLNPKVGKKQIAEVAHRTAKSFPFDVPSELDAFAAEIEQRLTNTVPLLSEMEPAALDGMAVRQAGNLASAPTYLRNHIVALLATPEIKVAMRSDGLHSASARIQGSVEHADA